MDTMEKFTRYACGIDPWLVVNIGDKNQYQYRHETGDVVKETWKHGEGHTRTVIGKGRIVAEETGPYWGDQPTRAITIEVKWTP